MYNFIGPEVYNSHDSLQSILRKIYQIIKISNLSDKK